MTSPATCPKCRDPVSDIEYHEVVKQTGQCWSCCNTTTSPAQCTCDYLGRGPHEKDCPALLSKEQLDAGLFRIKQCAQGNSSFPWVELSRNEAAALLAHFAALEQRVAELEALNAERNRQNAAAFAASDAYQKRCEVGDALLREARDYVYDYGSEATMAPLVARIDAHLAGAAMGGREGK